MLGGLAMTDPVSAQSRRQMEWRKRGDNEWWLVFRDAPASLQSEDGTLWPPSMSINWAGPGGCCHLYSYSNGHFPGRDDNEDDVDYLHICNLDDFTGEIRAFKDAASWEPAEWERGPGRSGESYDDAALARLDAWLGRCFEDKTFPTPASCVRALTGETP